MFDEDKVHRSHMLIGETISLRGLKLVINLIIMDMQDFDMILIMDFLSKYRVKIDYRKKKVKFNLKSDYEFTFIEGRVLNMMINNANARMMLSKRCITYLAHIINKSNEAIPSVRVSRCAS